MAANKQVIRLLRKQKAGLERMIARAGESISSWKEELASLVGAISVLGGRGKNTDRPRASKGRKRGRWKPGRPGRPPQWYIDQQKVNKSAKDTKPKGRRKRKVSPKVLAALAKARQARSAKRAAASKVAS